MEGRKQVVLAVVFMITSFFVFTKVFSASNDLIINEIAAYPTSTHEWIELLNTGINPIDITGWKFFDTVGSSSSKHAIVRPTSTTSTTIFPKEYVVVAQNAKQFLLDHPSFTRKVFNSSWSSLSEAGEKIGLIDKDGNEVEKFVFVPAPASSLERKNPYWNEYGALNWRVHFSSSTAGFVNSNFSTSTIVSTSTPTITTMGIWSQIKINEIMPNPENGEEWVELYNPTTNSLNLVGGSLCDNRTPSCTIAATTGTIKGGGWIVVPVIGNKLNNTGDSVVLRNPSSTVVDEINYSGVLIPKEGQALARKKDGTDSDSNNDWSITTHPTQGIANIISLPLPPGSGGQPPQVQYNQSQTQTQPSSQNRFPPTIFATTSAKVVINELYPNPPGVDANEEFIEIKNISDQIISLEGWQLRNSSKTFVLSGEIKPGEIQSWLFKETNIVLKNTAAEEIYLINEGGVVVSVVKYLLSREGESYGRTQSGEWQWTRIVTLGEENDFSFVEKNNIQETNKEDIIWNFSIPDYVEVGKEVFLSASGTVDMRGGELLYWWKIGTTTVLFGETVPHIFASSGLYTVTVVVSSSAGTSEQKDFSIPVGVDGVGGPIEIVLSEVFVDPIGDENGEYIEIYNASNLGQDMGGWKLRTKDKKVFTVPSSTQLLPNSFLVFYRSATKLNLNKNGEVVELLAPTLDVVDAIVVPKSQIGKSYSLIKEKWYWTEPTPHWRIFDSLVEDALEKQVGDKKIVTLPKKTANNTSFKSSSVKRVVVKSVDLDQIQEMNKGEKVLVSGVVTVLPGTYGTQYFYISNENTGIQIYNSKKDFPKISAGDTVEVQGIISEVSGVKRINTQKNYDIKVVKNSGKDVLVPQEFSIAEISEENIGSLVEIVGDITEIKNNFMYVDDGEAEISVSFKKGTQIDKKKFKEGEQVQVTGVVAKSTAGLQIWPRLQDDVKVVELPESLKQKQDDRSLEDQKAMRNRYVFTIVGGSVLLFLALAFRVWRTKALKVARRIIDRLENKK